MPLSAWPTNQQPGNPWLALFMVALFAGVTIAIWRQHRAPASPQKREAGERERERDELIT